MAESIPEQDVEKQPQNSVDGPSPAAANAKDNAEADPNIVTWDGPDDPANPMNWTTKKKVTAVGIVSFITFLSPLASTIISPATPEVMRHFGSTNETLGAFVTSIYILGYAFGPLVIAPLSEMYGRSLLYNINNLLFLIFTIACAVANSLGALIAFRFLVGIAASAPITLGAGTIADIIPVERRGAAMALWIMGPIFGPTIGPLIGSYLADSKGWRWIFWLVAIIAGAALILALVFMKESYAYVILEKKTQRLRKETGNENLRSMLHTGRSSKEHFRLSIIRPIRMLVLSPMVFTVSLFMATIYGYLYLLFTTYPRIFIGNYGFTEKSIGLVYIGSGVGSFIALFIMGMVSDKLVTAMTKRNGGKAKPEYRLPLMMIGAILIPIGLFIYAWTAEKRVHYMAPIVGTALVGAGMMATFMPGQTYLVDLYPVYAASVSAASTVLRSLLGAFLPLAGDSMYNALGVGWGTSLLGFIAVAFIPVIAAFWIFGERIRNSKIAQVEF